MDKENTQRVLDTAYEKLNQSMRRFKNSTSIHTLSAEDKGCLWRLLAALKKRCPQDTEILRLTKAPIMDSDVARSVLNLAYIRLGMHKFHTQ
jgi:hypothetical protein